MTCEQFSEYSELYVLGALETAETLAANEHLATGCAVCEAEIRRAIEQSAMVLSNVSRVQPPARLRRRIHDTFAADPAVTPRSSFGAGWMPWAIAAAAVVALLVGVTVEDRMRQAEARIAQSRSEELARLSKMVDIVQAPGTREVNFGNAAVDHPRGAVFIHQKLGIALVMGSLPKAPAGWKYESWVVRSGTPEPIEPFQPDERGRAVSLVPGPVNLEGVSAVAVSMEPQDARPVKPTKVLFAAPV